MGRIFTRVNYMNAESVFKQGGLVLITAGTHKMEARRDHMTSHFDGQSLESIAQEMQYKWDAPAKFFIEDKEDEEDE